MVKSFKCTILLAVSLLHALIEIAALWTAGEGQQAKMEMVYQYLTGQCRLDPIEFSTGARPSKETTRWRSSSPSAVVGFTHSLLG